MTKHSPGPWRAIEILWRPPGEGASCHREIVDARGKRVGEVWVGDNYHPDHAEGLANLRLVLKASDLLMVATEMAEALRVSAQYSPPPAGWLAREALAAYDAALEGESL